MADEIATPEELAVVEALLDAWFAEQLAENPVVDAVEKEREPLSSERRWFVRVLGEEKDVFTIWYSLRQRTLHYETYVMPAPEENHAAFYEHLLRRNLKLNGAAFADRCGGRGLPRRPTAGARGRPRRARSHPRLALHLRRAVLPPGPADRVRVPVRRLEHLR